MAWRSARRQHDEVLVWQQLGLGDDAQVGLRGVGEEVLARNADCVAVSDTDVVTTVTAEDLVRDAVRPIDFLIGLDEAPRAVDSTDDLVGITEVPAPCNEFS